MKKHSFEETRTEENHLGVYYSLTISWFDDRLHFGNHE
jgi:hypothetical protein